MSHANYFKDISHLDKLDVYRTLEQNRPDWQQPALPHVPRICFLEVLAGQGDSALELFDVQHPALQHALKKVMAAGKRGAKNDEKDVREAIDSLNRWLQMRAEDEARKVQA